MAHHKRKGPKSTRSGCLWCKPHKHQGSKKTRASQPRQEIRAREDEREDDERVDEDVGRPDPEAVDGPAPSEALPEDHEDK
jgi:hypothetical protein